MAPLCRKVPLPPLSLSEAPHPFVVAFPQLHISRLESVAGVARLPRFISGGVACSYQPAWFHFYSLLLPSSPLRPGYVSCLIPQNRLLGSLPGGRYPGWPLAVSVSLWDCPEANQWLNLGSSSVQTPCSKGWWCCRLGQPERDRHFSESLTRTRS